MFQRNKGVDLKLGHNCTRYFMKEMSGKRWKNKFIHLNGWGLYD
jgi:hypothetical protein